MIHSVSGMSPPSSNRIGGTMKFLTFTGLYPSEPDNFLIAGARSAAGVRSATAPRPAFIYISSGFRLSNTPIAVLPGPGLVWSSYT